MSEWAALQYRTQSRSDCHTASLHTQDQSLWWPQVFTQSQTMSGQSTALLTRSAGVKYPHTVIEATEQPLAIQTEAQGMGSGQLILWYAQAERNRVRG